MGERWVVEDTAWKRVEVGRKRMGWGMSELGRGEGADAVGNIWPRLARWVINFRS